MRTYVTADLERFLTALDSNLSHPFTMIVIGGAAAALAYQATDYTRDIDTMNDLSSIVAAYQKAKADSGLNIPMSPAGVADAPYHYEDRLQKIDLPGVKRLILLVPEKHDLALMKIMRGYENDLATIAEISKRVGMDLETLISRYQNEMTHVTGDPKSIRLNFLAAIERVFGESAADRTAKRLKS